MFWYLVKGYFFHQSIDKIQKEGMLGDLRNET